MFLGSFFSAKNSEKRMFFDYFFGKLKSFILVLILKKILFSHKNIEVAELIDSYEVTARIQYFLITFNKRNLIVEQISTFLMFFHEFLKLFIKNRPSNGPKISIVKQNVSRFFSSTDSFLRTKFFSTTCFDDIT